MRFATGCECSASRQKSMSVYSMWIPFDRTDAAHYDETQHIECNHLQCMQMMRDSQRVETRTSKITAANVPTFTLPHIANSQQHQKVP
jgi:hypothetical protein